MNAGFIVLIVIGSLLLLLALLLLSHVRFRVVLNENGSSFRVSWLLIRKKMRIEDASDAFAGRLMESTTEEERSEKEDEENKSQKKSESLSRRIESVSRLLFRLFDRVHQTLTLRTRRVVVVVSTGDAAKTALLYGAVSASLAGLIEIVDRSVARVKTKGKDKVDVRADFVTGKTRADLDLVFSARVFGMLRVLFLLLTSGKTGKNKKHKVGVKKAPSPSSESTRTERPNE